VFAAAFGSALLIGLMLAVNVRYGIAATLAVVYAPLVFVDLPMALACWVGLSFIEAVPALSVGPLLAFLLVIFGWLGTLRREDSATRVLLREQRGRILVVAALMLWILLSLSWAPKPGIAGSIVSEWLTAGVLFTLIVTTVGGRRAVKLVLIAFVVGAVVSVVLGLTGLVSNNLYSSATAFETAGQSARLRGGSGDPNFLAAGLVPAIVIAAALLVSTRKVWMRLLLIPTIGLLMVGFVATESRGGLLAAVVALLVSLIIGRRRAQLAAGIVAIVGVAAIFFAVSPGSWHRITGFDSQGNGRADLWQVGVEIAEDHPVVGVGVANFRAVSPNYVRRPGELKYVNLIAERPLVVHNAYLQTLTELGLVGLGLFLTIIFSSLRAALLAAREFERTRRMDMATLSRALFVAIIAMLTASFFISSEIDPRMWALFALGPALLVIARRRAPATA
jgi:O-antigen ligase